MECSNRLRLSLLGVTGLAACFSRNPAFDEVTDLAGSGSASASGTTAGSGPGSTAGASGSGSASVSTTGTYGVTGGVGSSAGAGTTSGGSTSGTGSTTGAGTTSGGSTSGAGSTGVIGDGPEGLVHINPDNEVLLIDPDTAAIEVVCNVIDAQTGQPPTFNFVSVVFNRENRFFGAGNDGSGRFYEIELPSCQAILIGVNATTDNPGTPIQVQGLAPAPSGTGLVGFVRSTFEFVRVDISTGTLTVVGVAKDDYGPGGLAWSEQTGDILLVSTLYSQIFIVDPVTGLGTPSVNVGLSLSGGAGLESHPVTGEIYLCQWDDETLYRILPGGGNMVVGPLPGQRGCNNLGTPWGPLP